MALETIMDAVAVKAMAGMSADHPVTGLPGLRACYSAGAADGSLAIPRTFDDSPVGVVGPASGGLDASNYELFVHRLELAVWVSATHLTWAWRTIVPMVQRARETFRSDIDAGGTACRVIMTGYQQVESDDQHGKDFLVLPIQLEALELEQGGNLYST
jgi:hypothetical protein